MPTDRPRSEYEAALFTAVLILGKSSAQNVLADERKSCGVFPMVPVVGQVMVLGYLATAVASAVEGALVVGGIGVLGAALAGIGVPKDSVLQYEAALKADEYLVTAHGSDPELTRARTILTAADPSSIELHHDALAPALVTLS